MATLDVYDVVERSAENVQIAWFDGIRGLAVVGKTEKDAVLLEVPFRNCLMAQNDSDAVAGLPAAAPDSIDSIGRVLTRIEATLRATQESASPPPRAAADRLVEGLFEEREFGGDVPLICELLRIKYDSSPCRFHRYISELPAEVSGAAFWDDDELMLLSGSTARGRAKRIRRNATVAYEACRAEGVLPKGCVYEDFKWAVYIVMSRAFAMPRRIPRWGDVPALIPFCDLANHADTPSGSYRYNTERDCFQIVAARNLEAGEQLTLCYGDKTNAELLCDYGFLLTGPDMGDASFNRYNSVPFRIPDRLFHNDRATQRRRLETLQQQGINKPVFFCEPHSRGSGIPVGLKFALTVLCCSDEEFMKTLATQPHRWHEIFDNPESATSVRILQVVDAVVAAALGRYDIPVEHNHRLLEADAPFPLKLRLAASLVAQEQQQWLELKQCFRA